MKIKLLFSVVLFTVATATCLQAQSWNQKGTDIDGEMADDRSGTAISMPDKNTLAIGAPWNDGNGSNSGHVRVYSWTPGSGVWIQKGLDINGEASVNTSGTSVSMPDSNTVAIGAPGNGNQAGHVRVYTWLGNAWIQKGSDMDGDSSLDQSGSAIAMPDNNTVAIGAPKNDGNGVNAGHVRIYRWDTATAGWIQKGADLDGEAAGDESGTSVSMPDSNTVAIGAYMNDGTGTNAGHVRIYSWDSSTGSWIQKGTDIDGEAANDFSGWSVSMPDSNVVSIGAYQNDGNGTNSGQVRVYDWNGSSWILRGADIDGEGSGDGSGWWVSMPDINTVAIGAPSNYSVGTDGGHVRVYSWDSGSGVWVQKGLDIDGEAALDRSGSVVCMPDSNTVAIGAYLNDGNGSNSGHVRVFSFATVSGVEDHLEPVVKIYPNPATSQLQVDLAKEYKDVVVAFKNVLGQEVSKLVFTNTCKLILDMPVASGYYLIEIYAGERRTIYKVVKNE